MLSVLFLSICVPHHVQGQALRLGRFNFTSVANLEWVYTTNVEGEREDDAEEGREDVFVVAGLTLRSVTETNPNSTLGIDTGISVEKHFRREDLDTLSEPFGNFNVVHSSVFGRYRLDLGFGYNRSGSSTESTFVPGGRKTRDVNEIIDASALLTYTYKTVSANAGLF
ncbi:MAG: hypothetical protein AAF492_06515, partial [Verrucomicrobiota bacterium]